MKKELRIEYKAWGTQINFICLACFTVSLCSEGDHPEPIANVQCVQRVTHQADGTGWARSN